MAKTICFLLLSFFLGEAAHAFQDSPEWLLAKLTGHAPIQEGITIGNRYDQHNREIAANYLLSQLKANCDEARIEGYSTTGNNVVGIIRATQPTNQWILLGAHYDSVRGCPGANDNGTGVVLVNQVAKHVKSLTTRNYNVYFVFFDEEEKGMVGSRAFAKKLKQEGIRLVAAHTIDQMGWDQDGDRAIELEMPTKALERHYRKVAKAKGFKFPIHKTDVIATDHHSFRELGYDAIGLTEEYKNGDSTPHYHQSTDTFETVNLPYLNKITEFMEQVFEALLSE